MMNLVLLAERRRMKIIGATFVYCLLLATIFSCKHHKLKKDDERYIPYKGTEILVFKSDKERMDTVFLNGISDFDGCGDPWDFFPDKCDAIRLKCTRSDPNYDRYLEEQELVEIVAGEDGKSHISFNIILKGAWFYNMDSYRIKEFEDFPNNVLVINKKVYTDVKVFEASEYAKQYEHRDNYAERFYWSLNHGFLGLDKRSEKWRLIEIYNP